MFKFLKNWFGSKKEAANVPTDTKVADVPIKTEVSGPEFNINDSTPRAVRCTTLGIPGRYFPNRELLVVGRCYNVTKVEKLDWYTKVYLEEFPGSEFNSCHFSEFDLTAFSEWPEFDIENNEPRDVVCVSNYTGMYSSFGSELTIGKVYHVTRVEVNSCYTDVYVSGSDKNYNSILFREIPQENL